MIEAVLFYIFAATAVIFALGVIWARNPIYSALFLIGDLFAVAAIFALQSAHLLALLQILVYAGAIMVLILFVIMLLNLTPRELGKATVNVTKVVGAYFMAATGILLLIRIKEYLWTPDPAVDATFGSIESVGMILYTKYLLPFEMVSVLLLAAIIGAVILTRKQKGDGS